MYTAKPGHPPKAWVQRRWPDARLGIESGADLPRQTLDFLQDRFGKSGVGTATSREVGTNGWSNVTEKADLPYARNDRAPFAFRYQAFAPPGRGELRGKTSRLRNFLWESAFPRCKRSGSILQVRVRRCQTRDEAPQVRHAQERQKPQDRQKQKAGNCDRTFRGSCER